MRAFFFSASVLALGACNMGDFMAGGERWQVVSVNGDPVTSDMDVIVQEGRIIGGYDGCADWSFKTPESPIVVGDGEVCAPDAARDAYWDVVNARRGDAGWGEGDAVLEAEGARMTLRRPD